MTKILTNYLISLICLTAMASSAYCASFSASHFGLGMETNAVHQMSGVGGSMFVLDWGKTVSERFSWGLKTMANGAHGAAASIFRLTSGPAVHYRWSSFEVHFSLGYFQESIKHKNYESLTATTSGFSQIIAFQRYKPIRENVELGWGSYLSLSQGTLEPDFHSAPVQNLRWGHKQLYKSRNQGIYGSLRVSL